MLYFGWVKETVEVVRYEALFPLHPFVDIFYYYYILLHPVARRRLLLRAGGGGVGKEAILSMGDGEKGVLRENKKERETATLSWNWGFARES